jgi:hypothetical protein
MTTPATHPVERAFQIARSGTCRSRGEIMRAMSREGFTLGECQQLAMPSLSRQLNAMCRDAVRDTEATAA